MPNNQGDATENLNRLVAFRQDVYDRLGHARDALFELSDAVLLSGHLNITSLAALSLLPVFRRKWPSTYEALQDGRPDREALFGLYAHRPTPGWLPYVVYAGDHTAWPRLHTRTLRDRTIEHQPNPLPGALPITIGLGFSTLSWIPEAHGSWALPVRHERIPSSSSPIGLMVEQIRSVAALTPDRRSIVVLDAEYGCVPFIQQYRAAGIRAYCLVRLRANLCLRLAPPPKNPHQRGRAPQHGRKFKLSDARPWGQADEVLELTDDPLGFVRLERWNNLHMTKAPEQPLTVVRIARPQARGTRRDPHAVWVAWLGDPPDQLTLATAWEVYFRRFALDHWYRFAKHALAWLLPHLQTPEQCQRWSDVIGWSTWELWLARPLVADRALPWQKPQAHAQMTPGRVRQSLAPIFIRIGTPAHAPKPRGKSPGWPIGKPRAKAVRYPLVHKRPRKRRKVRRKR